MPEKIKPAFDYRVSANHVASRVCAAGFTSRTHDWLANRASAARRDGEDADLGISNRASDVASNFHRGFLTLTLLLHGLLAGIAVWEVRAAGVPEFVGVFVRC